MSNVWCFFLIFWKKKIVILRNFRNFFKKKTLYFRRTRKKKIKWKMQVWVNIYFFYWKTRVRVKVKKVKTGGCLILLLLHLRFSVFFAGCSGAPALRDLQAVWRSRKRIRNRSEAVALPCHVCWSDYSMRLCTFVRFWGVFFCCCCCRLFGTELAAVVLGSARMSASGLRHGGI